jgi:SAM-dependent methyltransferase
MSRWLEDWQHPRHAESFDFRAGLSRRDLVRAYESFNDVRLLLARLHAGAMADVLEVGCATGEFSRYLAVRRPRARYHGVDISRPAVARAGAKYPHVAFFAIDPGLPLDEAVPAAGAPPSYDVVYSKDVMHHQTRPWEFLAALVKLAQDGAVLRTRTRDVGSTEMDPERSCQYHYDGWMPYLVFNLDELIERILALAPGAEIVVQRHHMVLGGRQARFLPRDCYLPGTGTAETAVAIALKTERPGSILVEDRSEEAPSYSLGQRARGVRNRLVVALARRLRRDGGRR